MTATVWHKSSLICRIISIKYCSQNYSQISINRVYLLGLQMPTASNIVLAFIVLKLINDALEIRIWMTVLAQGFVFTQALSEIWSLSIVFERTACKLEKKPPKNLPIVSTSWIHKYLKFQRDFFCSSNN